MTIAESIMRQANPHAMVGNDENTVVMIEDHTDPDGRIYRLEYQSTRDGRHAIAWCRYNPWGSPNAGEEYEVGHVANDGFICVGQESVRSVSESPYRLSYVIERARYWCTGFSVLQESGTFPHP